MSSVMTRKKVVTAWPDGRKRCAFFHEVFAVLGAKPKFGVIIRISATKVPTPNFGFCPMSTAMTRKKVVTAWPDGRKRCAFLHEVYAVLGA